VAKTTHDVFVQTTLWCDVVETSTAKSRFYDAPVTYTTVAVMQQGISGPMKSANARQQLQQTPETSLLKLFFFKCCLVRTTDTQPTNNFCVCVRYLPLVLLILLWLQIELNASFWRLQRLLLLFFDFLTGQRTPSLLQVARENGTGPDVLPTLVRGEGDGSPESKSTNDVLSFAGGDLNQTWRDCQSLATLCLELLVLFLTIAITGSYPFLTQKLLSVDL